MDPPDPASRAPCHKKSQLVAGAGVAAPYLRTTCPGRPCVDVRRGVVGSVGWVMDAAVEVSAARPGRGKSGGGEIVLDGKSRRLNSRHYCAARTPPSA